MSLFAAALDVADAVLFEGYVLYPYRASSSKNQVRWQWGVLMPPSYAELDPSERTWSRAECLLEGDNAQLTVRVRFLQVQRRTVENRAGAELASLDVGNTTYVPWDEAVERYLDLHLSLAKLPLTLPFSIEGGVDHEPVGTTGRLVRKRETLDGVLTLTAEELPGPYGVRKLTLTVTNATASDARDRTAALRTALVACHLLVAVSGGRFVSLLDPPEWAKGYAAECENVGVFPVLAGDPGRSDLVLASPIILYDHPQIAAESQGDLYDATEIDEILSLRTMTLTEDEKREVRGTDPRAAAVLDQVDFMPPDLLDRLHGTIRYLRKATEPEPAPADQLPWWDPGNDASVSPESDTVDIAGVPVGNGARVRLRPGGHRADAQDMFLDGQLATVAAVLLDVDGKTHVAVALDDEVGEIQRAHGRFLYFAPDELEPVGAP